MNNKVLNLTFASSITDLCEVNSSFDSGILRIAYTGENRYGSAISKQVFERCVRQSSTAVFYVTTTDSLILSADTIWNL